MKIFNKYINKELVIFILSLVLLSVSLILLARPNIEGGVLNYVFTNSDSFFHQHFYQDIIIERRPVELWVFPHAFLLLPEFLVFLIAKFFLGENSIYINILTSISTLFLLETSLFFLFRSAHKIYDVKNSLFILAIAFFNLFLGIKEMELLYIFLLTPHFHIGTVFNSIVALIMFERISKTNTKNLGVIILYATISFLFALSDPLYVIYFVIPIVIIKGPSNMKDADFGKRLFLLKFVAVLLSIIGVSVFNTLSMTTYHSIKNPQIKYLIPNDFLNKKILYTPLSGEVYLDNNLLLIFILIILAIVSVHKLGIPSTNEYRNYLIKKFLILNFFISLFLYLSWGIGTWIDFRVFTTPILIVFFSSLSNITRITKRRTTIILFLSLCLMLIIFRPNKEKITYAEILGNDKNSIKCIEKLKNKYEVQYGIADFWWTTKLNVLGNYKFRLLPIHNIKYRHNLSENKAMGDSRFENGKSIDYVFCGRPEEKKYAIEILGNPDDVIECPNNQWVLYYKNSRINSLYE